MKTQRKKVLISKMLAYYNLSNITFTIVPSVRDFLTQLGIPERDDTRMAVFVPSHNILILIDEIHKRQTKSVISGIWYRHTGGMEFSEVKEKIGKMNAFFKETILHEIAHAKGIRDEKSADEWAFSELHRWQ